MFKRILFCFIIFFSTSFVYSQIYTFKLTKDVIVNDGNVGSSDITIKNKQEVEADKKTVFFFYELEDKFYIYCKYNDEFLGFDIHDLELLEEHSKAPEYIKKTKWIMSYYYDMLKYNDLSILFENEKQWNPEKSMVLGESSKYEWNYLFSPLYLIIDDYYIYGSYSGEYKGLNLLGKGIKSNTNKYVFYIFNSYRHDDVQEQWQLVAKEQFTIIFCIDGDFLYVYKNEITKDNLLYTLARADKKTINQISNFVKTGKYDSTSITWPRHTDGTCDYEDVSSVKTVSTPTTNVAPNKTMTVSENLKLRSAEATTSEVITVMQAGTKVKILELGKAENIDGINSNWVKVEVQSGAKDRDGKTIRTGTVGWCYGGYLAETTEANNFESTDTKEISDIKIEEAPKQEINIGVLRNNY